MPSCRLTYRASGHGFGTDRLFAVFNLSDAFADTGVEGAMLLDEEAVLDVL